VVPAARRRLVDQLDRWGLGELSDDAALALSELVTNAVLHGAPPIRVGVDLLADGVRLEVSDGAAAAPQVRVAGPGDTIGRGIAVVESVSAAWGWRPVPDGKIVWCELRPPGAEPAPEFLTPWGNGASIPVWTVRVPDVPVDLLAAHVTHVEGQLRELTLLRGGAGVLTALGARPERALRVSGHRSPLLIQLQQAQAAGQSRFEFVPDLALSAVEGCREYLAVMEEVDGCCEAEQLLAMASPPELCQLRRWLLGELIAGVQRAAGLPAPPPRPRLAPPDRVSDLLHLFISLARSDTLQDIYDVLVAEVPTRLPVLRMGLYLLSEDGDSLVLVRRSILGKVGVAAESRYSIPLTLDVPSTLAARRQTLVEVIGREEMSLRFPRLSTDRQLAEDEQAWWMVPLLSSRSLVGVLALTGIEARPLVDADRTLLQNVAAQAAQALRRVQRLERDQRIAQTLQSSLLDAVGSQVAGLDVTTRYQPAQAYAMVGGDWHDVFEVAPRVAGISVGDVCGHGVEAAAVMGRVRSAMAGIAQDEPSPGAVLAKVNRMLCRLATAAFEWPRPGPTATDLLATALYGRLDHAAGTFRYAVAGHPGPIVLDRGARTAQLAHPAPNLPLGIDPAAGYREHVLHLPRHGRLVAFTDGLFERRDEALDVSLAALVDRVAQLADLDVEHLADALLARSTHPRQGDDIALVVLGW
jgi:serine phosphatase RsbU (regulator of sigma subunit)/anti-sigma regulatory factor (Ser/Thr protein kinase)